MTTVFTGMMNQQDVDVAEFPVLDELTRTNFTTNVTTHNCTMPATVAVGDLLLGFWANDGSATVSATDFTIVYQEAYSTNVSLAILAKISDGTEGGTTVDFVTTASEMGGCMMWRISNWGGSIASDIVVGTAVDASTSTPDPPSLTSGFGIVPTLWFACCAASGTPNGTNVPAGYSYVPGTNFLAGAIGNSSAGLVASCWRKLTADSEDPGTFTFASSTSAKANTVAVRGTT